MSKKLKPIPATASVKVIPGTDYVLIDGDKVARLLTPMFQGINETVFYNVFLNKKYSRKSVEALAKLKKSDLPVIGTSAEEPESPTPADPVA
jgi:hypothetical protein